MQAQIVRKECICPRVVYMDWLANRYTGLCGHLFLEVHVHVLDELMTKANAIRNAHGLQAWGMQ